MCLQLLSLPVTQLPMMSQGDLGEGGGDEEDGAMLTSLEAGGGEVGRGVVVAGGATLGPIVRSQSALSLNGGSSDLVAHTRRSISSGNGSLRPETLAGWDDAMPMIDTSGRIRSCSLDASAAPLDAGGDGPTPPRPPYTSPPPPDGGGGQHKTERRAVQAYRQRLKMAGHIGLSALLATSIGVVYPWSENLTWYGIVLSISGVGRNLGHTLQATKDSWVGAAVAVPLCLVLGQAIFSRVLTGVLVALTSLFVVACSGLPESAKKLALIFVIWDVLIPAVNPAVTIIHLLVNLLKALLGANIICLITILLPVPQLAVWDVCSKLEELTTLMQLLLETFITIFCMQDREVVDLVELLDQASSLITEIRALLPDVKMELWLFRSTDAYDNLVRYLDTMEGQMESLAGMTLSLPDIPPNDTHIEFVRQMSNPLMRLLDELRRTTTAATQIISDSLMGRPAKPHADIISLFSGPKDALQKCLRGLLRARMRVVYGREVTRDEASGGVVFHRSASAMEVAKAFMTESRRLGYMNLLPRNTFVLDLALFVESIHTYEIILPSEPASHDRDKNGHHDDDDARRPPMEVQKELRGLKRFCRWQAVLDFVAACLRPLNMLRPSGKYLQPFKVALAVGLSSIVVLVNDPSLGLQTIWGPLTVAQTMSSHSASSFKSGVNRVLGTIMGATVGMAIMDWLGVRSKPLIVVLLTLWVFFCGLHRTSSTYGEAAVSAALTAPIIVVGPVLGSSGLVVRNMQVIFGTVIYVVVDNLCFPVRAKASVREELVTSVQAFQAFWLDELTVFATQVDLSALERGKQEADKLRRSLKREEAFIKLAVEEPELWHKPFPTRIYMRVLSSQWSIFRTLLMLHRSSMTFPMELAEHDQAMLSSLQSILNRLKETTMTVFSEALQRLQALNMRLTEEDVAPLLSLSGLRQQFHKIETDTDAFIESFFAQDPVLTAIDFIVPLNGMIYSTRKLSGELLQFSQAVKELVDRERGQAWA